MKNLLLLFVFLSFASIASAQCAGCTTNVTGLSGSNYVVNAGQKLCISPTGTLVGYVAVNGGTLCNQGTISSTNLLVSNGGYFVNYGVLQIDSLLVEDSGSKYDNYGSCLHARFATITGGTSTNYSDIITDYIGDSLSVVKNYGNITVNYDLYNTGMANFQNFNYMKISRSFYNSGPANFYTTCKINVGQNWYNTGYIVGTAGCAGFDIGGYSANSGTVGPTAATKVDICGAGSPTSFDANTGNISNTTFCSCTNSCAPVVTGEKENELNAISQTLYPNPCTQTCSTDYKETVGSAHVLNSLGQLVKADVKISGTKVEVTTTDLGRGIYFLEVVSESGKMSCQKLVVE